MGRLSHLPTGSTRARPGVGLGLPHPENSEKGPAQRGFLVGPRSPARGASHLCHTVTIILHKIIIKNSNFSASNPASGLLARVCGPDQPAH